MRTDTRLAGGLRRSDRRKNARRSGREVAGLQPHEGDGWRHDRESRRDERLGDVETVPQFENAFQTATACMSPVNQWEAVFARVEPSAGSPERAAETDPANVFVGFSLVDRPTIGTQSSGTSHCRWSEVVFLRADDGIRTRDPHLGNRMADVSCVAASLSSAPEL